MSDRPLPKSLTDLQDLSRPFVERRAGPFELVTLSAKAFWETRGGRLLHFWTVMKHPALAKRLVDKTGWERVMRHLENAGGQVVWDR
jgi:hypothetical protein